MEQGDSRDPLDPTVYNGSVLRMWDRLQSEGKPVECETAAGTPYTLDLQAEPLSAVIVDVRPILSPSIFRLFRVDC